VGKEGKPDFKKTLNLPKTDFPMKASLPIREPEQLNRWRDEKIYQTIRASRKNSPKYILHDGPPYANGHIHMGHVLNKVLKDIVVKYKTLRGYDAPFIPGWDCHGLPIEHQLLKDDVQDKGDINQITFRHEARDFALKWKEIQAREFIRLGIFADWEKPYLTLDPGYEAAILEGIRDIYQSGHMVKARKPVYWSVGCETALAEAEVEYKDHDSPEVYVKFELKDEPGTFLVIWTTTPWTLPANLATAVHKDFTYQKILVGKETYIIAEGRREAFVSAVPLPQFETGALIPGSDLEGLVYHHPFLNRECPVILSEFVTLDAGTGCVHTAPGHGQEDYVVGIRNGLPVFSPVDAKGRFTSSAGVFEGQNVFEANASIIQLLKDKGRLLKEGRITHSYPHCWRSKTPIIFRATEQWFISMDQKNLRRDTLTNINKVHWVPSNGLQRIQAMVKQRPDWCISRQRLWGVPIPALKCADCQNSFIDDTFLGELIEKVKSAGVEIWFKKSISELSVKAIQCGQCGSSNLSKENDIVDVWFESGMSHLGVLKGREELQYPSDLYLEGSDQHRGWFQSSLLTASALQWESPFKEVLTHGFVVDAKGKKMSKSLGNVVDPLDIMEKYGADILRIWVTQSDYSEDLKLSREHFKQLSDGYRKVRNTFRYLLGNLYDYLPLSDQWEPSDLQELDQWMVCQLGELVDTITGEMDQHLYYRAWHRLFHFCNKDLSSVYFNILKDVLYCYRSDDPVRQSAQRTLYLILRTLVRCFASFIPFTTEEVWRSMNGPKADPGSLFSESWPEIPKVSNTPELKAKYASLFEIRDQVLKKLEELIETKKIQSSIQAKVILTCKQSAWDQVQAMKKELKRFFIVADVEIHEESGGEEDLDNNFVVDVTPMVGIKCARCWIVFDPNGEFKPELSLCSDCYETVKKLAPEEIQI